MEELDTRMLRYFIKVAELGSFTDAAEQLHVSQPALSQGIRRLETLIGVALLQRGPAGTIRATRLTDSGEVFFPFATEIVRLAETAVSRTRSSASRIQLRIGFGTSIPRPFTRLALGAAATIGHEEPKLEYVPWGEEIGWLMAGRLDLVFLQAAADLADKRLDLTPLGEMHRVAVFPSGHALAARSSLTLDDLREEPIIDAASDRDYWIVNPRPGGFVPVTVAPPARSVDEMLTLVSAGRGMAITSLSVAERYQSDDLSFVPISDLEAAMLYLASDRSQRRPEIAAMSTKTSALIHLA